MLKIIRSTALYLTVFGFVSCGGTDNSQPINWSVLPTETTHAIQSLIDETVSKHQIVGYSIGILQDGQSSFETYGGYANIEHQVPISPDSRYQIYSATKIFFNVALMQLIERGELDPDETLGNFLPNLPDAWKAITIRQAWSHTTGLTDIFLLNGMESTEEEALQRVINNPLKFSPGAETEYNQTNFLLLKMVFETITKTDYQTYLKNNLLTPVGTDSVILGDTSFVAPNLTTSYEGHPYEVGKLGRRAINFPPYVYTSAGVNISLNEFSLWWHALLEGQLIKKETLQQFWEPVLLNNGVESERSNGWERQHKNGIMRIGHGGGARVHLFHYIPDAKPEQSVTVIFLNNGAPTPYFDHRKFGDELAEIILKGK